MQQRQYSDNELFGIIQEVYFGATSWEQGRQAALRGRTLSDNPETPDTISYDEWKKGFVHGAVYDVPQSEQIEEIVMVGILPVIEVQVPEMLFGCTVRQRLWFYDRLGKQVVFEGGLSRFGEEASIIAHSLAGNYHSLGIDDALIWDFVRRRPDHHLSGFILDAVQLARWMDLPIEVVGGLEAVYRGESLDDVVCPIVHGALDIDSDGRTISCIEKGGTNDYTSHGNIFETREVIQGDGSKAVEFVNTIHDVLTSPSYLKEVANARRLPAACRACDERMLCQANCGVLHEQWNQQDECPGFKTFIKRVRFLVEEEGVRPKSVLQGANQLPQNIIAVG